MDGHWRFLVILAAVITIAATLPKLAESTMALSALHGAPNSEKYIAHYSRTNAICIILDVVACSAVVLVIATRKSKKPISENEAGRHNEVD